MDIDCIKPSAQVILAWNGDMSHFTNATPFRFVTKRLLEDHKKLQLVAPGGWALEVIENCFGRHNVNCEAEIVEDLHHLPSHVLVMQEGSYRGWVFDLHGAPSELPQQESMQLFMHFSRPTSDIADIISYIARRYMFDAHRFPALNGKSPEEIKMFAVQHLLNRTSAALGDMAKQCEYSDRNFQTDDFQMRHAAAKIVTDNLRLLEVLGITPEEYLKLVPMHVR